MRRIDNQISKIKYYFVNYQAFIFFSILLIGALLFISSLPYVNIFLTQDNIISFTAIAFWIANIILFGLSYKTSFILGIIFCFFSYLLLLLNISWLAEQIGNIIYILFVTGVLQLIFSYLKKGKID